jgi:hypothetical protein
LWSRGVGGASRLCRKSEAVASSQGTVAPYEPPTDGSPCSFSRQWMICCVHVVPAFTYVAMNTSEARLSKRSMMDSNLSTLRDGFCGTPRTLHTTKQLVTSVAFVSRCSQPPLPDGGVRGLDGCAFDGIDARTHALIDEIAVITVIVVGKAAHD